MGIDNLSDFLGCGIDALQGFPRDNDSINESDLIFTINSRLAYYAADGQSTTGIILVNLNEYQKKAKKILLRNGFELFSEYMNFHTGNMNYLLGIKVADILIDRKSKIIISAPTEDEEGDE